MADNNQDLLDFVLQMADNSLILGHRLSEWCGHGPALEQDIALANIALDHVGQARMYFQLASTLKEGTTEDTFAFNRTIVEYKNLLILEQENKDFAYTVARSFLFDHFHILLLAQLKESTHKELSEIAAQAIKEVQYHCRYSADWVRRLGDGTEVSHEKMQKAINDFFMYTGEFFKLSKADNFLKENYGIDIALMEKDWRNSIESILIESTLDVPSDTWFQDGGKKGMHTEKLGFLLAELQYMQRAYPNMSW